MSPPTDPPVVIVAPTIMDGTVVRWYRSVAAAEQVRASVSASRRGVAIHEAFLTDVPPAWVDAAREAHRALAANRRADLGHLATHRNRGVMNGPIVSVEEGQAP